MFVSDGKNMFRIIPTMLCMHLASLFYGVSFIEGAAMFTQAPPSVSYFLQGENATFLWDYYVDDRLTEFDGFSPKWIFYEDNATSSEGFHVIGFDNKFKSWEWEIASSCPPRLLNPTRVDKVSTATLVIFNVTTDDSGIYGCSLIFKSVPNPETNKTRLIVTVSPRITLEETKRVTENDTLIVTCSAVGPPTPDVTWKRSGSSRVLAFGVNGSAVLKIYKISRDQSGEYVCLAENNPKEAAVEKKTNVIVQYPVEFDPKLSTESVKARLGDENVVLKSFSDGVPAPTHVWFLPSNKKMVKSESVANSTYTIEVVKDEHIGNWTVNVTNGILSYYYVHTIEVIKLKAVCGCTTAQIVGFVIGLLVAGAIIVAIALFIHRKKKEKKEWKDWTTPEKIVIPFGLLVAIAIIIVVIVFIIICICK